MRTFALSLLAVVSLVVSSGCCCCGGGGMRQSCGYRGGCGASYSPCGGGCSPCGVGGAGYGGTYAPGGAPAVIGPQQGTMLTPTSSSSAYIPSNNQVSAVPLESLPTY